MHYVSADTLRFKINNAGIHSIPFVFAIDYEMENCIFVEHPFKQTEILFRFGNIRNYEPLLNIYTPCTIEIANINSSAEYAKKFKVVQRRLFRGDSYLANLTTKAEVKVSHSLSYIMKITNSPFGICVNDTFISFSPERFVKIENGIISSNPMKGTIDASAEDAERTILNDYKEMCEHNTIVDLIRNDIGMVAKKVWIERFSYIDNITTDRGAILQVSSEIKGELPENYSSYLGDIILKLLPAGSISGAPKKSTLNIISEAEGEKRGFYTGIFGFFDGKTLDSAVTIRYIEKDSDGQFYYRSGGGITVNSDCEKEYNEIVQKIYLPK